MSSRVYCTNPVHRDGDHDPSCIPPAEPDNPELRLMRAIWGLCPDCDDTEEHEHPQRQENWYGPEYYYAEEISKVEEIPYD